jgi:hypothetical protein
MNRIQNLPSGAAPLTAIVEAGATVAIVAELKRIARPTELAVSRTSAPWFEVLSITIGLYDVPFRLLVGCEDGGTAIYELSVPDAAMRNSTAQAVVTVRCKPGEGSHAFKGALFGPLGGPSPRPAAAAN